MKVETLHSKRHLQLVKLAGDLAETTCEEAQSLGFMSRLLLMVNLPYRNPGKDVRVWLRENGSVSLIVTPAYNKKGKSLGFPYGTYPRLILAYVITQAVKTRSPEIFLGKSFREFLNLIGIEKGGHQLRNVKKQLERTLSASFSWTYEKDQYSSRVSIQIANQTQLWWNQKSPEQQTLWESRIELNHHFFKEILRKSVPLDFRVLKTLKNSPLGLDLYMFVSWRIFNLKKPVFVSWKSLHNQLGGQYLEIKEFGRDCRKHLKRIQAIWPELNISFIKGRICLYPTSRMLISINKVVD